MRETHPMKESESTVGTRIRALRHTRGMTQDELAAMCDVSRSAVAQWETDRAGQLRGNITRIADALATNVEFLLQGERPTSDIAGDELALLRLYRECDIDDQAFLLRTARKLARTKPGRTAKGR
jgi:transcriptional regulator with XRE-family HTH domain